MQTNNHRLRTLFKVALVALIAQASGAAFANPPEQVATPGWRPCASNGFDCATVTVPLDYADPDAGKIDLAVIRHLATDATGRVGTLFFNPGGPGGQGTTDLPDWFELFPASVRSRFDIVSWDPRGIGNSTAVQCFANPAQEAEFFSGIPVDSFPATSDDKTAWIDRLETFAGICKQRNGRLLSHVSTTDTARDLDFLRQVTGDQMLNYLGVSYGTLLGAVYANLFPDRVRAMVLDGNVDPVAWTNNGHDRAIDTTELRIGSSQGAADSLSGFLDQCGAAGASKCPFSTGEAAGTHAKFDDLLQLLKAAPVTVDGTTIDYAAILTAMHGYFFTTLAEPGNFKGWDHAATVLQTVWASAVANAGTPPAAAPSADATTPSAPVAAPPTETPNADAEQKYVGPFQASAVECGESPNARPPGVFRKLDRITVERFGPIGSVDLWADEPCASWKATAAEKYEGPWDHSTPGTILLIGNTHDPSTPYDNTIAMSKRLSTARVLTVDGYGHTALLNPSACAGRYEDDYFLTGALPAEGTVCRQDAAPFK